MALPIGGFMPIPLAMMIPFMATQSMVMGDAFGRAFQYGKRKISAMSNEEFNATSLEQQASEMFKAYKIIIGENHLQNAIKESQKLQEVIIREMLLILPRFASSIGGDISKDVPSIQTIPEDHAHTSTRPHTHSGGPPTITGKTISNGVTTTHYSDGSTTTSGTPTPPTPPPPTVRQLSREQEVKLTNHYQTNVDALQQKLTFFKLQLTRGYGSHANNVYKSQIANITRELTQQKLFLSRVKRGLNPY